MALPLQAPDWGDVVAANLRDLGRFKWTNIMSIYQNHPFLDAIMKKERTYFDDGYGLQFNVAVLPNTNARMTGLAAPDMVNINDGAIQGKADWRQMVGAWGYERRELLYNRSPSKIFDEIKFRRVQCMMAVAELLEAQGWGLPGGANDNLNLWGIPYTIVPNTVQGFTGLNPFGYTTGAYSIDSTKFAQWANYSDSYINFSKSDLVRKLRRLSDFTHFVTPSIVDDPSYNTGRKYGIYTTYVGYSRAQEISEQQNDALGRDLAPYSGKYGDHAAGVSFRQIPLLWVSKLDTLSGQGQGTTFSNSTYTSTGGYPVNPYYCINWGEYKLAFLKGDYMREDGPHKAPNQHNLYRTFIDFSLQLLCYNRRAQGVLTQ